MPPFYHSSIDLTISIDVTALYAILLWWSLFYLCFVRFIHSTPFLNSSNPILSMFFGYLRDYLIGAVPNTG